MRMHKIQNPFVMLVNIPEISGKSNVAINNQNQLQTQNPAKSLNQDVQLHSLNVYASNYDMIPSASPTNPQNGPFDTSFKPSFKLPEMEHNFTPLQNPHHHHHHHHPQQLNVPVATSSPVLMQYLPQAVSGDNGVQYLQLIPTRPLIVPISPFLTSQNNYAPPPALTQSNSNIDYAASRSPSMLNGIPANIPTPTPVSTPIIDVPHAPPMPYGLATYAAAITPYKQTYRINRETKDNNQQVIPFSLNLNEYIPSQKTTYTIISRGRP
uniref:Uncharacterized protein n=1 Tax=Glossina morsitans morsitans TaxID=37546 RepID=A0A1B0FGE1_GLOMM